MTFIVKPYIDILIEPSQKPFLGSPLSDKCFFSPVLISIGCHGNQNVKKWKKNSISNHVLRNLIEYRIDTLQKYFFFILASANFVFFNAVAQKL